MIPISSSRVVSVGCCGRMIPISSSRVVSVGCCGRMQSAVKTFIDSAQYQRAVLAAILINTLSMGIEYHNQVTRLYFHHVPCVMSFLLLTCNHFYIEFHIMIMMMCRNVKKSLFIRQDTSDSVIMKTK